MKIVPTLTIAGLAVFPFWWLAKDIGGDEVIKTLGSVALIGVGAAVQAILKLHSKSGD